MENKLRRGFRETTWTPCIIRTNGTRIIRGLITNISGSGAELRCKFPFEAQQRVEVFSLNQSSRRVAHIVRDDGNRFGLKWVSSVE